MGSKKSKPITGDGSNGMQKMAGGKVSSTRVPRMHLIPKEAMDRLARRFEVGIERRPDGSAWNAVSKNQEALLDLEFILDRIGHVMGHCLELRDKIVRGEPLLEEDDAGAIIWGGAFLCCATRALEEKKKA